MFIIGLTGGIGSGKSTIAGYFARHGIPVLDADQLARELVAPGSPALSEILAVFGPEMRLPDGSLDRAGLRRRVFADPELRRRLEAILHPRVYAELRRLTQALRAPYCIWVVPLLLETHGDALVDRVLVVDTPEALQHERVLRRAGMDEETFQAILRTQAKPGERLRTADDVIVNDAGLSRLQRQVAALHRRYLELAAADRAPASD